MLFKKMIAVLLCCLILSSCATPTEQPPIPDTGENTTSSDTVAETVLDTEAEPNFIAFDLNDDGVEERLFIDATASPITLQIKQAKEGGDSPLAELTFSNSEIGGYYLRRGESNNEDELLYWSCSMLGNSKLQFRYEVFTFENNGEKVYPSASKRWVGLFDMSSSAHLENDNILFLIGRDKINSLLVDDFYDVFVLVENRGEGIVSGSADNMIVAKELTFDLKTFYNNR